MGASVKLQLAEILTEAQIIPDLGGTNRWEAIEELIDNLVATERVPAQNRDALIGIVKRRESSFSSGIGFGIAIPHASTDLVDGIVGVMGRSEQGIDFGALDGRPVTLLILFLVPQGQFQEHLHTLADVARLLHEVDIRRALEEAPDAGAMLHIIKHQVTMNPPPRQLNRRG